MKLFFCLAQLALFAVCASVSVGESKADDKEKALFQEYMQKYGPPGPEHKVLDQLVGSYNAKVKTWMAPDQSPEQSTGTLVRKAILGGRFIQEDFDGKMMDKPFQGIGTVGYDRAKKTYVSTWIDSASTALRMAEGTYDEANKTLILKHEGECPITGKHLKTRDVLHIVSADEQQMEMFRQLGDEKEMKVMEITITRKK
jgi:hypothetical protein